MADVCNYCEGTSFDLHCGKLICEECGTQKQGYVELQSQETFAEVDKSRVVSVEKKTEKCKKPPMQKEETAGHWTSYDVYTDILCKWTKIIVELGASPHLEETVRSLWIVYLQMMNVAFIKTKQENLSTNKTGFISTRRDFLLLHKDSTAVDQRLLSRPRKKRRRDNMTKMEKFKRKLEKRKGGAHPGNCKLDDHGSVSSVVVAQLSKTLNSLDGDSDNASLYSNCTKENNGSESPSGTTSGTSVRTAPHASTSASEYDTSSASIILQELNKLPANPVNFVKNWVESKSQIYEDSQDTPPCLNSPSLSTNYVHFLPLTRREREIIVSFEPYFMNLPKLIALIYLGILLSQEKILLMDLIRWCHDGHIPYSSAVYLLSEDLKFAEMDKTLLSRSQFLLRADLIHLCAGRLAMFLCIEEVPLPSLSFVADRLLQAFRLPESMKEIVIGLSSLYAPPSNALKIPDVEGLVAASIIVAMKFAFGLDGTMEIQISDAVKTINTAFEETSQDVKLFSWKEWQRYASQLLWWNEKIHTYKSGTDFNATTPVDILLFKNYFWSRGVWNLPKLNSSRGDYAVIQKLMELQGTSIEEALDTKPLFAPTFDPYIGTMSQFVKKSHDNMGCDYMDLLMVAEKLMSKSFTAEQFGWSCDLHATPSLLKRDRDLYPESSVCDLLSVRGKKQQKQRLKRKAGNCTTSPNQNSDKRVKVNKQRSIVKDEEIVMDKIPHVKTVQRKRGITNQFKKSSSEILYDDFCTSSVNSDPSGVNCRPVDCSLYCNMIQQQLSKNYWKLEVKYPQWKLQKAVLSKNFRWLVEAYASLCETREEDIISKVSILEKTCMQKLEKCQTSGGCLLHSVLRS